MATLKTQPTAASVEEFIQTVENETKRDDSRALIKIMENITGEPPVMWGASIIGFGSYDYKYESGREGSWFLCGFSPRKQALTLYIMSGFSKHTALMESLGKHKTSKGCLYIKKLSDINLEVLTELIEESVAYLSTKD